MSTVHQPAVCTICRESFLAPTKWVDGVRMPTVTECGDCANQGVLFGGES